MLRKIKGNLKRLLNINCLSVLVPNPGKNKLQNGAQAEDFWWWRVGAEEWQPKCSTEAISIIHFSFSIILRLPRCSAILILCVCVLGKQFWLLLNNSLKLFWWWSELSLGVFGDAVRHSRNLPMFITGILTSNGCYLCKQCTLNSTEISNRNIWF